MSEVQFKTLFDKSLWESYVITHPQANFLQSYNWGRFEEQIGKSFFPVAIYKNDEQIGAAMIIKELAKRGNYLTIAGGPLVDWQGASSRNLFSEFCDFLKKLAKEENCHFVRVRPQVEDTAQLRKLFEENGFLPSPMHLTADLTLRLNLSQDLEELLAQMRKNTRYEIRKSERLGIKTKIIKSSSFMKEFHDQQLYLAKKHGFIPFDYQFLLKQFEVFAEDDQVAFINSYYNNELLASAFVIFYQNEAVYHYGVSTPKNERLPGSYATQWAAIKEAKKRGCSEYNFWGVSPLTKTDHRFAGPSLFKRGFGGYELQHLPAHDLPVSSRYQLIRFFELMRKKIRRL